MVSQLQISGPPIAKSGFVRTGADSFKEVALEVIDEGEVITMMNDFAQHVFDKSLAFESDLIEVISLSIDYAKQQISAKGHEDMLKTLLVAFICWLYMTLYMKSLFLSTMAILTIVLSLPVSIVIYKGIFGIEYFSSIHIAVIIIVIGIGADDIFVFHDSWVHAYKIKQIQ